MKLKNIKNCVCLLLPMPSGNQIVLHINNIELICYADDSSQIRFEENKVIPVFILNSIDVIFSYTFNHNKIFVLI